MRLQRSEHALGRTRTVHWGPRTIDLDLLMRDDGLVVSTSDLDLLIQDCLIGILQAATLASIVGNWWHPLHQCTIAELWHRLQVQITVRDGIRMTINWAFEGLIGVGKTTLAQGMAQALGCDLISESDLTNPFLEKSYAASDDRWNLACQLQFLERRLFQTSKASARQRLSRL